MEMALYLVCRICAENTQSADNEPSFPGLSDDMIKMMGTLESISPEWDAMLEKISRYNGGYSFDDETNIHINEELKQAAQYFVFRHFTEACDDGEIISKAYFAHFGCCGCGKYVFIPCTWFKMRTGSAYDKHSVCRDSWAMVGISAGIYGFIYP